MKILFVSVEVAPFAKVGGLADVAGALPKALRAQGHDVRVVMPLYEMVKDRPEHPLVPVIDRFTVQMNPHWSKEAHLAKTEHDGLPVYFVGTDEWFTEAVDSGTVYQPGGMQHLFFSTAVLTAMEMIDWIPDVVHCHDWHTGFLPVIMREKMPAWNGVAALYTMHNVAYQGEFGLEVLDALDLPHHLYNSHQLETWGRVNFLKAGCVYSDHVNTVSKTYAREIQTPEYGAGLDGLMAHLDHHGRLSGIVNGIDTDVFNPATDPDLPVQFDADSIKNKATCRAELIKELGLKAKKGAPLVGMVSRLSSQKGMDMVLEAAEALLDVPVQLVVLGLGEPAIAEGFAELQRRHPKQVRFVQEFNAPLGQRIYAGCDAFLMPSNFEPCGLGQLIAMRYGTVPVVRATGGLVDTVFDGLNGFVFQKREPMEMLAAVERMQSAFNDPEHWNRLVRAGMTAELDWRRSAREYEALYEACVQSRLSKTA